MIKQLNKLGMTCLKMHSKPCFKDLRTSLNKEIFLENVVTITVLFLPTQLMDKSCKTLLGAWRSIIQSQLLKLFSALDTEIHQYLEQLETRYQRTLLVATRFRRVTFAHVFVPIL